MTVRPGRTPCLRCLFEEPPEPGSTPTCDTVGVLAPAVATVASFQAQEAIKICAGREDALVPGLVSFDVWNGNMRRVLAPAGPRDDCPCCGAGDYTCLEGRGLSELTSLCGHNAVQVLPPEGTKVSLADLGRRLQQAGEVKVNEYLLRVRVDGLDLTVFPDGRAIIKGTDDRTRARAAYARYVGH